MTKKKFRIYRDADKWSQNKDSKYASQINQEIIETTGFEMKYFDLLNVSIDDILSEYTSKTYETMEVPEIFGWWEGDDPIVELERAGILELLVDRVIYVNKYKFHNLFNAMPRIGDVLYINYLNKWVEIKNVREYEHRHGYAYYSTMYSLAIEDLKLDGSTNLPIDADDAELIAEESALNEAVEAETDTDGSWDGIGSAIGEGDDYVDWIDTSDSTNIDETMTEAERKRLKDLETLFPDEIL